MLSETTAAASASRSRLSDSLLEPGSLVLSKFRVRRMVGEGGMGQVYQVENERLGRCFALKVVRPTSPNGPELDPMLLARFRREAELIAQLSHANIVHVVDWEVLEDGSPFLLMEWIAGEGLDALVAKGPMTWTEVCRFGDQLLSGVAAAHARGIVHRDLKPANVMIAAQTGGEAIVKILDFGIAKADNLDLTTSQQVLGTPVYMAPEQACGEHDKIGPHTDLWAVGAILYEMAAGRRAFADRTLAAVLRRVCDGDAEPLESHRPDAPEEFTQLVADLLRKDPFERLGSATQARRRLLQSLQPIVLATGESTLGSGAYPVSPRPQTVESIDTAATLIDGAPLDGQSAVYAATVPGKGLRPEPRERRKWPLWVAASVAIGLSVVAAVYLPQRDTSGPAPGPAQHQGEAEAAANAATMPTALSEEVRAASEAMETGSNAPAAESRDDPQGEELLPPDEASGTRPKEDSDLSAKAHKDTHSKKPERSLKRRRTEKPSRPSPEATDSGGDRQKGEPVDPFRRGSR